MSVNVRWNGRGWPGKVPRSPVASPEKGKKEIVMEKSGRPKGTVKCRMAKKKKVGLTDPVMQRMHFFLLSVSVRHFLATALPDLLF
jgi:hypothetical protein